MKTKSGASAKETRLIFTISSHFFKEVDFSFLKFGERFSLNSCRKIIMLIIQSIPSYKFVLKRYAYLLILLALVSIIFLSFHHGFSHS